MRKEVEDSLFLPHEIFHPETDFTNMTYRSFHPGRTLTAIELDFFDFFKVKPLNLWIYFQNFYNFACMLMNGSEWPSTIFFTSFACLTCLQSIFIQNLALSTICITKKTIGRKVPFKTILISETGKQSSRGPLPGIH